MKTIKKLYHYFFYKIYKSIEYTSESQGAFWSEWKASFVLIVLEIWSIASLLIYYKLFIDPNANIIFSNTVCLITVVILTLIDYRIFHHQDKWKEIILNFDQLSKRKNITGSWLVFGITILIVINFILSFYLYYQN